jgi:hypothetical protein
MQIHSLGWTIARILFGLFFLYAPIMVIVSFGGDHPLETVPAAARFAKALNDTRSMNPALIVDLLLGGALLLSSRFAPLGLLLLGPPIFVIACFHWFLTGSYVWGSVWPLWYAALAWHYRHVFARLWERR